MPKKQLRTPEARADLVLSVIFELRSLTKDSPDKTYSLRYPHGTVRSVYKRLVALTGERGEWDAVNRIGPLLERFGMLLIAENGSPQAVKIAPPTKEEPVMPQEGVECQE